MLKLKSEIPEIAITSDIISGFPGEAVNELRPEYNIGPALLLKALLQHFISFSRLRFPGFFLFRFDLAG